MIQQMVSVEGLEHDALEGVHVEARLRGDPQRPGHLLERLSIPAQGAE